MEAASAPGVTGPAREPGVAVPAEGWNGFFSLLTCISLYLIHGFTLGTRKGPRVKFRSDLILQNQAFDVGCDQRLPSEWLPDGSGSGHVCERVAYREASGGRCSG